MRTLPILVVILLCSTACFSQNGSLNGKVIFKRDSMVIPGAIILLNGTKFGAQANIHGDFSIKNLQPGKYDLIVSAIGYGKDTIRNINVTPESESPLILGLPPGPCFDQVAPKNCPVDGKLKSVIRIAYGLPDQRILKRAKRGKVKLGGCEVNGCEPHWYCKEHDIEF